MREMSHKTVEIVYCASNLLVSKRESLLQWALCLALAATGCVPALAQKNEIGVVLGGYVPIGSTFDVSPGVALEGSFAHRLIGVPMASVYAELPVAAGFRVGSKTPIGQVISASNYSALFIAPGLKLKLAPSFPVSPWFAVGVGYARFHSGSTSLMPNTSENKLVADVGGGIDMKIAPFVSLRGEVRDFHTTSANALLTAIGVTGHNIVAGGGLVLRF